jgi:hypothetical protein
MCCIKTNQVHNNILLIEDCLCAPFKRFFITVSIKSFSLLTSMCTICIHQHILLLEKHVNFKKCYVKVQINDQIEHEIYNIR